MGKKKRVPVHFEPLNAPLIDSHCHVVPRCFEEQLEGVIERASSGGLEQLVNIGAGYGMEGNHQALEVHCRRPWIHPTVGIHPHDASLLEQEPALLGQLESLAARHEVVAYGEIGLDYHYNYAPPEVQKQAFRKQLEVAARVAKPVIIHDREAHQDVLDILDEARAWTNGVIIHCFSGDWPFAEKLLERGASLGIPGVVTFKNAGELKEVVVRAPLGRLLIETDSPFLAPVPYRGKRNEPAFVHAVAREVARLRNLEPDDVARATADNARAFFSLPLAGRNLKGSESA